MNKPCNIRLSLEHSTNDPDSRNGVWVRGLVVGGPLSIGFVRHYKVKVGETEFWLIHSCVKLDDEQPPSSDVLTAKELKLGDMVTPSCFKGAFATHVVKQITETHVHLFRAYVTTSDFTYTGGVIPYIGIEEYAVRRDDAQMRFTLLERPPVKR